MAAANDSVEWQCRPGLKMVGKSRPHRIAVERRCTMENATAASEPPRARGPARRRHGGPLQERRYMRRASASDLAKMAGEVISTPPCLFRMITNEIYSGAWKWLYRPWLQRPDPTLLRRRVVQRHVVVPRRGRCESFRRSPVYFVWTITSEVYRVASE